MKLDIFTMKDLKCFLMNEFGDKSGWYWDDVAKKVMEWVEARQKKESEAKIDEWFYNLSPGQKDNVAEDLWENLSPEDKKEIASLE